MKPKASNDFFIDQDKKYTKPGFKGSRDMRQAGPGQEFPEINLSLILQHLWRGLCKLLVALRYALYKAGGGVQFRFRLPWFKLGLAALAVFILTKKDIQFSINMKAPLAGMFGSSGAAEPEAVATTQQLGLVQPLNFKGETAASTRVASPDDLDVQATKEYIERFRKVAIVEMRKFGIPASIKMAQGLLESEAGTSTAAVSGQNHFGPAFAGDRFDSAWENWRAHSLLLQREYKALLAEGMSYRTWAKGLKKMGYSKDPQYGDKLMEVIERYQLYLLDEEEL